MTVVVALAVLVAVPSLANAQGPDWIPHVGFLGPSPGYQAFREGLRDLGYVEGQSVIVEYRADEEPARLAEVAAELAHRPVDVIVAPGKSAWAARAGAGSVPIVFGFSGDPVEAGFVASLARPGGNMTGVTFFTLELAGKRLELLKEIAPRVSRVAVLAYPDHPGEQRELQATRAAARILGVTLLYLPIETAGDVDRALQAIVRERADAVLAFPDAVTMAHRRRIAEFAAARGLASVFGWRLFVEDGGLLSYGPNLAESYRRTAGYVDKILKGARPGALPVEQPAKFELAINLRTARALGLIVPPFLLAEADHVVK